ESALYQVRDRCFAATLGTWLQRDSIQDAGKSLYAYTGLNPLSFVDPFGDQAQPTGCFYADMVAKSFITPLTLNVGQFPPGVRQQGLLITPDQFATLRLRAFAAGVRYFPAFNQNPPND